MKNNIGQYHLGKGDNVAGSKYEIHLNTSVESKLTQEEIINKKNEYCTIAPNEYTCLPIIENEKILDIEKIYVTLALTHDNLSREKVFIDTSGISFENSIQNVDIQRDLGSPQKIGTSDSISLQNILHYKKVVILGEPGIGKSTLLKKLFIDICKEKCFPEYLPIYIPLSNAKIKELNFIKHFIIQKYKILDGVLEQYIAIGRTFFLLDGLDEIDYNEQQLVSNVIDQLTSIGNRVFLTCRMAVFPKGLLSSDFKIFECIGFNSAQRRKFLRLWFDDDVNFATLVEKEIVNNWGTVSISRNPLLLSLIVIHFEDNKYFKLPRKRITIYLKSLQLLLARREKKNIWEIPIDTRINILEYIAYNMNLKNIDVISNEYLKELIIEWKKNNQDSIANQYSVEIILKLILEIDGILYPCSKQQKRFLHLILQESLAASYLSKQKCWFDIFKNKLYAPRWEETLRLLVSLVTTNDMQNSIIVDYLYDQLLINRDQLFLIGRYLSDTESSNTKKFYSIFNILLNYVVNGEFQYSFTDGIVTLANICNSHITYREYLINYFKIELEKSYESLYIYIKLLKLMPSRVTRKEIIRLMKIFSNSNFKKETTIYVLGMLLNALEFYSDLEFWQTIFHKYVNISNSHLSGIIAESLSNIQTIEMFDFLEQESRNANQYINSLISYILQKYEDENYVKRFVITTIKKHNIYVEQTFSNKYLSLHSNDILELIKKDENEISLAILLDSNFSFDKIEYCKFLEDIIFDDKNPMILRCSALNTYLSRNNNKKCINKIIGFLKQNHNNINLQLVCINNLSRQENLFLSDYFFECGINLHRRVICSLLRVLSTASIEGAISWIQEVLEEFEVGDLIHMYALLALANQGYPDILCYLKEYITKLNKIHLREKVLIIKVLSVSNINNKTEFLVRLLQNETDPDIISLIIESMGYIRETECEDILLQYLDISQWPSNWPPLYPELKRGEQRPTDRRMIMLILSLNKISSKKAIPILEKIYNDILQSDGTRQTAYIAYKNLKWNNSSQDLVRGV